jgi:DNA gyrase subunit A
MTLDPRAVVPDTLLAISARGYGLRFAIAPYNELTTKAGRRYAKTAEGDEIVGVVGTGDKDVVVVATSKAHVLVCLADEINKLENPGRGVTVIKTEEGDHVVGFLSAGSKSEQLVLETEGGKKIETAADPKKASSRGGKGHQVIKRTTVRMVRPPVQVTPLATASGGEGVH